jgi:hypothetical protein
MEGIIIDVSESCQGADREISPVHLYAGSDNPVTVSGVPSKPGNCTISAVKLVVTNADGAESEFQCLKATEGWTAIIPASHLARYGKIEKGLRVVASGKYGGATKTVCLGIAELTVEATAAWAEPGTGSGVAGVMSGTQLNTASLADLKTAVRQIGSVLGATVL